MKSCRIAILGATGAVGRTMLQVLEEQTDWPIGPVKLLASPRSAGQTLTFKGQPLIIEAVNEYSLRGRRRCSGSRRKRAGQALGAGDRQSGRGVC